MPARPLVAGCWWRSESADHPVDPWLHRAVAITAEHGGTVTAQRSRRNYNDAAGHNAGPRTGAQRSAHAVSTRRAGSPQVIAETFKTRLHLGRRFDTLHAVTDAARTAIWAYAGPGSDLSIHPCLDGPARRYGICAAGAEGRSTQWDEIKAAVSGDQRQWRYHHPPPCGRSRPPRRANIDPAASRPVRGGPAGGEVLDPAGILNPGVLLGR